MGLRDYSLLHLAFAMGIDIDDIANVIHWGPTDDILDYWQDVNRCGRDGRQGYACMYSADGIVMLSNIQK